MLSIVIPVFNEEENINSVIEELLENIDSSISKFSVARRAED